MKYRLSPRDLFSESMANLAARPTRSFMTALGTMLGIGGLVATVGLTNTAGDQIVSTLQTLAPTQMMIQSSVDESIGFGASPLTWASVHRVEHLSGVITAASMAVISQGGLVSARGYRSTPKDDTRLQSIDVVAADPTMFNVIQAHLANGRFYDAGHNTRADHVAVLGADAAKRLNIAIIRPGQAIKLNNEAFAVAGIFDDSDTHAELQNSVIIPSNTAAALFNTKKPSSIFLRTMPGAVRQIAQQAQLAVSPSNPSAVKVVAPPEPVYVRKTVAASVRNLLLIMGLISLAIGGIGIANMALVGVLERQHEIGLRRALGATPTHVAAHVMVESAATGLLGGFLGMALGVFAISLVSASKGWTPVIDPRTLTLAPIGGAIVGLLAGVFPALRAAHIEPALSLRSS